MGDLVYCYEILLNYYRPIRYKSYITRNILIKIVKLIIESIKSGAHIRWLRYMEVEQKNKISNDFNIFACNSHESSIVIYNTREFILALYCLTKINKESLVFLYDYESNPNVLFTADSDLNFLKNITLKNNSIITAPHHGSVENNNVYKIVTGNDLIYVRSDRSQTVRPCPEYVNLKHKYCTICRNKGLKKQVELDYNGHWETNNTPCNC